jgi:hypothetical protein
LPSRDRRGRPLSTRVRQRVRKVVFQWFADGFPGSTEDRIQMRPRLRGRWGSESGVTIEEVEEIWTYCGAADFHKQKPGLVELAELVVEKAEQEAIAILVDSGMEIVVGKETS